MMRLICVLTVAISSVWSTCAQAADAVDFGKQILPIFMEHCAGCHGEEKGLGKLRLHTPELLQEKLAAKAEFLVAGKPDESSLFKRLILPADDKKRMPKKADPLAKEKIELIRLWIEQGALGVIVAKPDTPAPTETEKKEAPKELPLPEVAAAPAEAVNQLTSAGAQVMPLFAESSLLQVSFALSSEPSNDANVALLGPAAEQVYSLNLAGSKATDEGLKTLAQLKNLTSLHLENSTVTDAGLAQLAQLSRLQYLNLYGTGITDAGLAHLEGLSHLKNLYLWKTNVSYDVAMAMQEKIPGLQVNLGFDHPVVVRKRLTKDLERTKKQAEEAKANEEKLTKDLEAAKKQKEAVQKQLDTISKELADLDGGEKPAEEAKPAEEEKKAEEADKKA